MKFKGLFTVPALCLGFLSLQSLGFAADYYSPRTASLGGAGHAGPLLNDAIYLNPSFTSLLPTYSVSASWLNSDQGEKEGRIANFSILDGRTALFQAGLSYTLREDARILHLVSSKALSPRVSVGVGFKMILAGDEKSRSQDTTLSATYIGSNWFQTSLHVDNLIGSNTGRSINLYRHFVVGTKFNIMSILLLYIDPHWTPELEDKDFGVEAGAEFVVMSDLFLRTGMSQNAMIPYLGRYGDTFGIGAGWVAPRISLDYGFSKARAPVDGYAHTFGATVYF